MKKDLEKLTTKSDGVKQALWLEVKLVTKGWVQKPDEKNCQYKVAVSG